MDNTCHIFSSIFSRAISDSGVLHHDDVSSSLNRIIIFEMRIYFQSVLRNSDNHNICIYILSELCENCMNISSNIFDRNYKLKKAT